jgi:ATP-dependent DNA helicase RecQ
LIAIDEAHCISQWGYDFRPSYTKLSNLRSLVRKHVPIIALTASATDKVQEDIIQQLQLQSPKIFRQTFLRPNLSFSAFAPESKIARTVEILKKVTGSALVYCNSRKKTVDISKLIQQHGIAVSYFHAGLSLQEKEQRQNAWIKNELRVMVCTNAFGMGIDKSDVRLVIHYDVPDCLENYYQEAGRAGRDGQKSYAVLLYGDQDTEQLEQSVEQKFPPISILKQLYQKMADYLQVPSGSGEGLYYDFDWEQFVQRFEFEPKLAKNGLKHIEQEGFIIVEESVFIPSKVQVLASRDEYETFTNAQTKLLDLIMVLLRSYQGIVDQPVSISERKLAHWLSIEEGNVRMQLLLLHSAGIISYIYKKETPQLYFVTNRAPAAHLNINNERYLNRKELYNQRIKKMIGYTNLESGCRNYYIASYFDDSDAQACGICDLCLQQKKKPLTVEEIDAVYEVLEKSIDPLSAASIAKMTVTISETKVLEALRRLKDEQVVDQVEKGFVIYKKTARRRS